MRKPNRNKTTEQKFLQDLVLLRNDPELLLEVIPFAEDGNINAQYALGLIYAEGRGTNIDMVKSYVWLSRAIKQGDSDAQELRNIIIEQMSEAEIATAERILSCGQTLH